MVCAMEEDEEALCIIRDFSGTSPEFKVSLDVHSSMTVREFVTEVARRFNFEPDSIQLISPSKENPVTYTENNDRLIKVMGVNFQTGSRNLFIVEGLNGTQPRLVKDDLELGASASPEEPTSSDSPPPPLPPLDLGYPTFNSSEYNNSWKTTSSPYITPETSNRILGFRGLVNQAMTCYLNSLLQALYMTPEFRNAVYNWKFDFKSDESKSIPYQLQKLFLNLQMSAQSSVHTTELTRSFGWDSSEAWQQHDIQELCRVMFDALEHEFNGTSQADLINRLYGGKMIDYVKCLECGTEKTREDTYLDIPLPIRPFGSVVAYSSVEEALRGFVQPETLEGNNQYYCERCNKKCNAHKGLKFSKFPYLLTLHLMRFDFDYSTMHRIKLNDKVTFPEVLNLNSFISAPSSSITPMDKEDGSEGFPEEIAGNSSKCDDSSTTDSGSAIDDESCVASSNDLNNGDYEDIDEGIDMTSQENEKNRKHRIENGPSMYELFAIMVHSGSATGGHYYVLVKDFHSGEWYCFNDQSVSRVTHEDISKVYGGGSTSRTGYYSSMYSASNNAYMLMYRQIDKERNVLPMTDEEFPIHIKQLVENLEDKSEFEVRLQEKAKESCKIKVFIQHPTSDTTIEGKIDCTFNTTLQEVTQLAYNKLQLTDVVPLEQCRLVSYNSHSGIIEDCLDGKQNQSIGSILSPGAGTKKPEMWMDIRKKDSNFVMYKPGSILLRVYNIQLDTDIVDNPVTVYANLSTSLKDFKSLLYSKFQKNHSHILHVYFVTMANTYRFIDDEQKPLRHDGFYSNGKLFICFDREENKIKSRAKIRNIVDRFEHTLRLNIYLPDAEASKNLLLDTLPKYPPIKNQRCLDSICWDKQAILLRVYNIQLDTDLVDNPVTVYVNLSTSLKDFKSLLYSKFQKNHSHILHLCFVIKANAFTFIDDEQKPLRHYGFYSNGKLYICFDREEIKIKNRAKIRNIVERFEHTLQLNIDLPDAGTYENEHISNTGSLSMLLSTPALNAEEPTMIEAHNQLANSGLMGHNSDQSASEDSSLTDSDRTIIGETPQDDYQMSSPDSSPRGSQCSSSPTESLFFKDQYELNGYDMEDDYDGQNMKKKCCYFKEISNKNRCLEVEVDKRTSVDFFKKMLEPYVGISPEYFKIYDSSQVEFDDNRKSSFDIVNFNDIRDEESIYVRLGRSGDLHGKVYLLDLNNKDLNISTFLFDWRIDRDTTVGETKHSLLQEISAVHNINIPFERCRLRKKVNKAPSQIYVNHKIWRNVNLCNNWELYVQELPEEDSLRDPEDECCLLLKKFDIKTGETGPFQEIIVLRSLREIQKKISEVVGDIPEDRLCIGKEVGTGDANADVDTWGKCINVDWKSFTLASQLNFWLCAIGEDGCLFYYRDSKDEAELTKPLKLTSSSPRREKSLRIYVDK